MKKILSVLFVAVMMISVIPISVFADELPEKEAESGVFYVDSTSDFGSDNDEGEPVLYTRSSCFELYSKEWCHAHGYFNNRPVAPETKVKLNEKEMKCVRGMYGDAAFAVAEGLIFPGPGVFFALARMAFNFYNCLS